MKKFFRGMKAIAIRIGGVPIGWLGDHPRGTNLLIALGICVHAVGIYFYPAANFWSLVFPIDSEPVAVSLTMVGAGALLAGFAGVVIVFGLQNNSERFRRLRRAGGHELNENWTSMSSSGFWTMGAAIVAALCFSGGWGIPAAMLLEGSLLVLAHGSVRLIWMLRLLIRVVATDDEVADRKDRTADTQSMPFMQKRTG